MSYLIQDYYEVFAMSAVGDTILLSSDMSTSEKQSVLYFPTFQEARRYYDTFRKQRPDYSIKMIKRTSL